MESKSENMIRTLVLMIPVPHTKEFGTPASLELLNVRILITIVLWKLIYKRRRINCGGGGGYVIIIKIYLSASKYNSMYISCCLDFS